MVRKTNYKQEKRSKELEKQRKKEAKKERKDKREQLPTDSDAVSEEENLELTP